jgi:co-chaperonin GroES (HSP10)
MDIRPLHDRVVLKRDERQRHSAGGILIPDTRVTPEITRRSS